MYKKFCKRILDLFMSLFAMIILLPVFLIIFVAIKLDSKGSVIFLQNRVGRGRHLFQILKFRTMRIDTPKDIPTHQLTSPDQYITKVGRFLRKTSMDELPQIYNILKGDMSFIGPRPALWNQDDLVLERDKYGANDIRPGLTGWAQINGRDELEIPVKAKLDGEYVKRMNFLFDFRCFLGTFVSVFSGKGVIEGGTGQLKRSKGDMSKR